ncbi:lipopolysaccharide biosynthesis protein [Microbacterium sp. cx-55]|uniref:lipopolysaccharide biosynthesis protein n=1 Tax=Microbacterium sp. cx-55 TaxID=2875948 RepID=UPI001CBBC977|nr:lipopolysaccharide biosynthesis protein [Microbacterium sp. cx-55]MBZ4486836.1 lipopolysaccharide biosynthesis protein [Microbacterium sp. cx-55]UGB35765.1 lipopolysaccharide biosynthesis protein [Microbacterium sp. cx-55]
MAERTLGRAALGGAGATALWQLIRLVLLGLSIVLLARLLDPSDYGLVAMATAIIGVGELLRDMGLSMASVQARTVSAEEKSNLFWINSLIGAVLTVVVYALAGPIADLYGRPELVDITHALAFTFLINGVATQFKAQINRDLRFMTLGFAEAAPQALGLAVAIVWAINVGGYGALVAQALVVAGGGLLLDVALARWMPGWVSRKTSIRRFLGFGGALAGTQTLAYVSKNLDTVLLGLAVGSTQLGWYNRGYQIVVLPLTQLTAPMSRVAVPVLSRVQDQTASFDRFLRAGQFFSVGLASVLYGVAIGLAYPLVEIVLGPSWMPVAPILQVLAVSGVFRAMGQIPYWLFLSKGHAGKQFRFYLVAQPIIVVGIVAGLPFGVLGVATGVSVGYGLFWIAQMLWAARATETPTGGLILSALAIVGVFGVPVVLIGTLVSALIPDALLAAGAGVAGCLLFVAIALAVIPPYRRQLRDARGLMRK